jgi:hypothetical protein
LWRIHKSTVEGGAERWSLQGEGSGELTFGQLFSYWRTDEKFRTWWSASLGRVSYAAYCWECPPVTAGSLNRPFECVFVSSPLLAQIAPDPAPFVEHFRGDREVVTFESLGRDALLVAPCPETGARNFAHLASFIASASQSRKDAIWRAVGEALEKRLGVRATWLSTAGLGVAWLHVRLDSRPKYYRHAPYKLPDQRFL